MQGLLQTLIDDGWDVTYIPGPHNQISCVACQPGRGAIGRGETLEIATIECYRTVRSTAPDYVPEVPGIVVDHSEIFKQTEEWQ